MYGIGKNEIIAMSAKNVIKEQYKKIKTHESKTKSITSALEFLETRLEQLERLTNIAEDLRIDAMARQVSNMVWKNFTRKDIVLLASKLTPFQLEVLGLFRELNGTSEFHEGLWEQFLNRKMLSTKQVSCLREPKNLKTGKARASLPWNAEASVLLRSLYPEYVEGFEYGYEDVDYSKSVTKAKENESAVLEAFARSGHADKDRIESVPEAPVKKDEPAELVMFSYTRSQPTVIERAKQLAISYLVLTIPGLMLSAASALSIPMAWIANKIIGKDTVTVTYSPLVFLKAISEKVSWSNPIIELTFPVVCAGAAVYCIFRM